MGHLSSPLKIKRTFCKLNRSMTDVRRGCTPLPSYDSSQPVSFDLRLISQLLVADPVLVVIWYCVLLLRRGSHLHLIMTEDSAALGAIATDKNGDEEGSLQDFLLISLRTFHAHTTRTVYCHLVHAEIITQSRHV